MLKSANDRTAQSRTYTIVGFCIQAIRSALANRNSGMPSKAFLLDAARGHEGLQATAAPTFSGMYSPPAAAVMCTPPSSSTAAGAGCASSELTSADARPRPPYVPRPHASSLPSCGQGSRKVSEMRICGSKFGADAGQHTAQAAIHGLSAPQQPAILQKEQDPSWSRLSSGEPAWYLVHGNTAGTQVQLLKSLVLGVHAVPDIAAGVAGWRKAVGPSTTQDAGRGAECNRTSVTARLWCWPPATAATCHVSRANAATSTGGTTAAGRRIEKEQSRTARIATFGSKCRPS